MVVNAAGTGHNAQLKGYDVSGKTGTAQVISLEGARSAKGKTSKNLVDHGWFVFFAPRDHPQIAGVVFAEHGLHGSNAALVARHAMEVFFAKKEGRPLPEIKIKGVEGGPTPEDNPDAPPPPAAERTVAQVAVPAGNR
jgi:penicillin-binding protein 2